MLDIELVQDKPSIMNITDEQFSALPEMKDEASLATMRILMNLCAPTYVLQPELNMRVCVYKSKQYIFCGLIIHPLFISFR